MEVTGLPIQVDLYEKYVPSANDFQFFDREEQGFGMTFINLLNMHAHFRVWEKERMREKERRERVMFMAWLGQGIPNYLTNICAWSPMSSSSNMDAMG